MNIKMLSWKSFVLTDAWSGLGCNPKSQSWELYWKGGRAKAGGKITLVGADLPSKRGGRRDSVQYWIQPQFFPCSYEVTSHPWILAASSVSRMSGPVSFKVLPSARINNTYETWVGIKHFSVITQENFSLYQSRSLQKMSHPKGQ